MSRLIAAARSRPEIDISKYFGYYEFSVVPKSLFLDDGKLVPTKDKCYFTRVRILVLRNKTISVYGFQYGLLNGWLAVHQ